MKKTIQFALKNSLTVVEEQYKDGGKIVKRRKKRKKIYLLINGIHFYEQFKEILGQKID